MRDFSKIASGKYQDMMIVFFHKIADFGKMALTKYQDMMMIFYHKIVGSKMV